ncbi:MULTISPECIES: hypothetical protein [unclassified Streptomyces]|uniref:hypothetical protein n=1 Tax=unclassified Streptomyces TaxID=2593676 RepID=UPI002E1B72FA
MVDVTGGPPMSEADWAGLFKSWFLELANFRLRQITWADIDQHRDYIESLLGTVTATTIHQRLRDEHKLQVPISAFRRWAHATLPDKVKRSQVCIRRQLASPATTTSTSTSWPPTGPPARTGSSAKS